MVKEFDGYSHIESGILPPERVSEKMLFVPDCAQIQRRDSLDKTRESGTDKLPFVIRAHHLITIMSVVMGVEPSEIAREKTNSIKRSVERAYFFEKRSLERYARDTIGETPEQERILDGIKKISVSSLLNFQMTSL